MTSTMFSKYTHEAISDFVKSKPFFHHQQLDIATALDRTFKKPNVLTTDETNLVLGLTSYLYNFSERYKAYADGNRHAHPFIKSILKITTDIQLKNKFKAINEAAHNQPAMKIIKQAGEPAYYLYPFCKAFMDRKTRNDLGVFYTPEKIANASLDSFCDGLIDADESLITTDIKTLLKDAAFLDYSCGAGAFFYALHNNKNFAEGDLLFNKCMGYEIEPVAAVMCYICLAMTIPKLKAYPTIKITDALETIQCRKKGGLLSHENKTPNYFAEFCTENNYKPFIIGNPPYANASGNTYDLAVNGDISHILKTHKEESTSNANIHTLQNYFIAMKEWFFINYPSAFACVVMPSNIRGIDRHRGQRLSLEKHMDYIAVEGMSSASNIRGSTRFRSPNRFGTEPFYEVNYAVSAFHFAKSPYFTDKHFDWLPEIETPPVKKSGVVKLQPVMYLDDCFQHKGHAHSQRLKHVMVCSTEAEAELRRRKLEQCGHSNNWKPIKKILKAYYTPAEQDKYIKQIQWLVANNTIDGYLKCDFVSHAVAPFTPAGTALHFRHRTPRGKDNISRGLPRHWDYLSSGLSITAGIYCGVGADAFGTATWKSWTGLELFDLKNSFQGIYSFGESKIEADGGLISHTTETSNLTDKYIAAVPAAIEPLAMNDGETTRLAYIYALLHTPCLLQQAEHGKYAGIYAPPDDKTYKRTAEMGLKLLESHAALPRPKLTSLFTKDDLAGLIDGRDNANGDKNAGADAIDNPEVLIGKVQIIPKGRELYIGNVGRILLTENELDFNVGASNVLYSFLKRQKNLAFSEVVEGLCCLMGKIRMTSLIQASLDDIWTPHL